MKPRTNSFASMLLAYAIGIFGAMVLMNWAACDSYDKFCAFTGVPR